MFNDMIDNIILTIMIKSAYFSNSHKLESEAVDYFSNRWVMTNVYCFKNLGHNKIYKLSTKKEKKNGKPTTRK